MCGKSLRKNEHNSTIMNMTDYNDEAKETDSEENTVVYAIGHTLGYIHGFIIGYLFGALRELSHGFRDGYPKFHPKQGGEGDE